MYLLLFYHISILAVTAQQALGRDLGLDIHPKSHTDMEINLPDQNVYSVEYIRLS